MGHLERTLPGMLKVKAALEQGKLGRITVARAMRQRWIENLPNKEWWKLDANLTGGELFHLIHELDLLCWLLGDIEAVLLKRLIKHITIRQTAVMCCSCYYVLKMAY